MARNYGVATTSVSQALAAATAETLIQLLAAANVIVAVQEFGVSFDGVSGSAVPVLVELVKQTTAGTGSARAVVKTKDKSTALSTTALDVFTAEPTSTDVYKSILIHPQSGIVYPFALNDGEIEIPGGGRLGLRVTAPAVVNARAYINFEE